MCYMSTAEDIRKWWSVSPAVTFHNKYWLLSLQQSICSYKPTRSDPLLLLMDWTYVGKSLQKYYSNLIWVVQIESSPPIPGTQTYTFLEKILHRFRHFMQLYHEVSQMKIQEYEWLFSYVTGKCRNGYKYDPTLTSLNIDLYQNMF